MHWRWLVLAFLALLPLTACGPSDGLQEVSGKVTWNGESLEKGDITFSPENAQFGSEAGKITAGTYRFKARPGKNKVQIYATRLVPGKLGPMGEPATEMYIPAKYNTATTLSADVAPGTGEHDFTLTEE